MLADDRLGEAEAWLTDCLTLVDHQHWEALRPWPIALLGDVRLRQGADPQALRPALEEAFALGCQLLDPCWEGAVARVLAMTHAATDDLPLASHWLDEAQRRCAREIDGYAALQVEIRASQAELARRRGLEPLAGSTARAWISLAARTHMTSHIARAAAFIAVQ